jgi:hypothetical protein
MNAGGGTTETVDVPHALLDAGKASERFVEKLNN